MKVAGIVAEYNPFHNGHAYLIKAARDCGFTHIVAAMSGNFTQRGDIAICDKWSRTQMALLCGVDLVLETPIVWALTTAEKFAYGAVSVLNSLGILDSLVFGSESGDINKIKNAVSVLLNSSISDKIKMYMQEGTTFATARQEAICDIMPDCKEVLIKPNDNLAINYLCALNKLNSKAVPNAIKRTGIEHNSNEPIGKFASASTIRQNLLSANLYMPTAAYAVLVEELSAGRAPCIIKNSETAFLSRLRELENDDFKNLPDVSEGIENRVIKSIKSAITLEEIYDNVKTKRYSHARIRRIVLSAALGIKSDMSNLSVPYIRVLGMNERGKEILNKAQKKSSLPIITKFSQTNNFSESAKRIFVTECKADDLYALCSPKIQPCGKNMTTKLIVNLPE